MASGFCMTGRRARFLICAHTHRGLLSEYSGGDIWILCCLATGWQNPWGKGSICEATTREEVWGNNWRMQRQPTKFNHDHLHHSGGNQVTLLQKLRFLLWISITRNYISAKINVELGGDLWMPNEWTDNSTEMVAACSGGLSHLLHNRRSISDCLNNLLISTWRETCQSIQAQTMRDSSQAKML